MKSDIVKDIRQLLGFTPIIFEGDPLLLVEFSDVRVERDLWSYIQQVDHPDPMPVVKTILLGPVTNYYDRWPIVKLEDKTPKDVTIYNRYLFNNFEPLQKFAFNQKQIRDRILEDIDVDVIVLLLIDGLSYTDWMGFPNVTSCLVPGPTITPVGFRNIIGKPTLAELLFQKNFTSRVGFSYWDRDESLSNELFFGFDQRLQIKKVREFKDVLKNLPLSPKYQTFIQIIVNGLDFVSHRYRGRPPIKAIAENIYHNYFLALCDHLHNIEATALVYATSDHGILWRPDPDEDWDFISLPSRNISSHRYAKGLVHVPHSKEFSSNGTSYFSLEYPYIFKKLSTLEWGVHGGISFQESVVPFVKEEVS